MEEGGTFGVDEAVWRRNPFDMNAGEDPFYQGASWMSKTK